MVAKQAPDLIVVTESHAHEGIFDAELAIAGYQLLRVDRPPTKGGGGVVMHIREDIPVKLVDHCATEAVNTLRVSVGPPGREITVLAIYRAPTSPLEDDALVLQQMRAVANGPGRFLICGDLNAPNVRWAADDAGPGRFGRNLLELYQETAMHQHVETATRYRAGSTPSLLDLLLTRFHDDVADVEVHTPIAGSDHVVITAMMTGFRPPRPPPRTIRIFSKLDTPAALEEAATMDWGANAADVEGLWTVIKENLLRLTENHVPQKVLSHRIIPPWLKPKAFRALAARDEAWARYRWFPTTAAEDEYRHLRNRATAVIRSCKDEYDQRLAESLLEGPKRFFAYFRRYKSSRGAIPAMVNAEGESSSDPAQKADTLARFFHSVFREDDFRAPPPSNQPPVPDMPEPTFSEAAVSLFLSKLDPRKSPGPDGIHPAILRGLAPLIAAPLASLFSRTLEEGVPADWRTAVVTPIHKKGRRDVPDNYRPISLTSVVCKVQEFFLREAITGHVTRLSLINPAQHGFVAGRSTLTSLLTVVDQITRWREEGLGVDACFLDFAKAFDTVNHRLLLVKLERLGIAPKVRAWIASFLMTRTFQVRVLDANSQAQPAPSGVPQGSVLGPLLFILYLNDLPGLLRSFTVAFADDLQLMGPSTQSDVLAEDLQKVGEWAQSWHMSLSVPKSLHLHLGRGPAPILEIDDVPLTQVDRVKNLGVIMTADLKQQAQTSAAIQSARGAFSFVRRCFRRLTPVNFLPAYKGLVRPLLEYGMQAWSPSAIGDCYRLEQFQRMATRQVRELRGLSYDERLRRLNLFSLQRRRLRGDLISVYRILRGFDNLPVAAFFELRPGDRLRGHPFTIKKNAAASSPRASSFAVRVVNDWNRLPQDVVLADTVASFKRRLDAAWPALFPDMP